MKTLVAVEGQTLRWYGKIPEIADNSVQFVQLEFSLPEDWVDLVVVAQFSQTKTYNKLLEDGCCYLPAELVAGPCEVSLFGQRAGENVRATSVPLRFKISRSGFTSTAETPIPPTPDLYAQLLEKLGHKGPSESVSIEDDGEGNVSFAPGFEGDGEDHELKSFTTGKTVYSSFSDKTARRELRGKLTNPGGLTPGQVLKVKSVDENGDVVLEGVDMPSGGSSVAIDTTLTQPGQAADAKATGDAISKLSQQNVALTTAQINALHGMFKVCLFDDSKDVDGAISAFEAAFGITDSGGGEIPDEPDQPGGEGGGTTGDALPTDGLMAYFDLRNLGDKANVTVGTAKGVVATQGNGALYSWASQPITSSDEYGAVLPRGLLYNPSGQSAEYDMGDHFTMVVTTRGGPSGWNAAHSNVAYIEAYPEYVTADGTAKAAKIKISGDKTGYNTQVYCIDGATQTMYLNSVEVCRFDGADYADFVRWAAKPSVGVMYNAGAVVAAAFYNRALTETEIVEAYAFMQTLEVSE